MLSGKLQKDCKWRVGYEWIVFPHLRTRACELVYRNIRLYWDFNKVLVVFEKYMTNYRVSTRKAFSVKTLSGIFKSLFWFVGLISIVRSLVLASLQQYFRTGSDLWRKGSRLFPVHTYLARNCNFFSPILLQTHFTARFFSLLDRELRSSELSWEPKVLQSFNSVWASFKLICFCSLTVFF